MKRMTETQYERHCDNHNGLCLGCGTIRRGDTEPDAEGYPCKKCKCNAVVGIETALMMGELEISCS